MGLIQLGRLGDLGAGLLRSITPALGRQPSSAPFGGALLCYYAVLGFLGGWLVTQLYLGQALSFADQALELLRAADQAHQGGAESQAAELREEAIRLVTTVGDPSRRYESVRKVLPSGPGRTEELERIVTTARHEAATGRWDAARVITLFDSGQDGDRITALGLMQGDIAALGDLDRVIDAIARSRSGFEQYHALLTGLMMLSSLDAEQRRRLADTVRAQTKPGGHIKPGKERTLLAHRILAAAGS